LVENNLLVNLKEQPDFIEQYVQLRNLYCELLVTRPVNIVETKEWLKREDIEIRGIVRDNLLIGVVILFLNRGGEITFFSRVKRSGLGSKLLSIIEIVAEERGHRELWAWVLCNNLIAQRAFLKNSYKKSGISTKKYQGQIVNGFVFRKTLHKGDKT
jgi:hypothetical protein